MRHAVIKLIGFFFCALILSLGPSAFAKCQVASATLPVMVVASRPLSRVKINGEPATFIVDSGAFFSMVTQADASKFRLPRKPMPFGMTVWGATGAASAELGVVDKFTLGDSEIPNLEFIVTGSDFGEGATGLIGQNLLGRFDVDYDLAQGKVRLLQPSGCSREALADWFSTSAYSALPLLADYRSLRLPHALVTVYLDGKRLTAMLDTGAANSIISEKVAARAGVTRRDPQTTSAGRSGGVGKESIPVWIAKFKTFKIGSEEIENPKFMFGELQLDNADMLLGADFFLSHRVLISNSRQIAFVSLNGRSGIFADRQGLAPSAGSSAKQLSDLRNEPLSAGDLALRASASASRHDFSAAVLDFNRALEQSPDDPDYLFQRARAYLGLGQFFLAMADLDRVLKLKPDDAPALIVRAGLNVAGHDPARAVHDLETADRASADQDDDHLALGRLFEAADALPAAIRQFDLWLHYHPDAGQMPIAFNGRCWARALLGKDLQKALDDCNQAVQLAPNNAAVLNSRALVHLRRQEFDAAIRDYDAALILSPKLSWALYGRGLAERQIGEGAKADADIAAATAVNPMLPKEWMRRGIEPSR